MPRRPHIRRPLNVSVVLHLTTCHSPPSRPCPLLPARSYFSTLAEAARQALVQPPSKEQVQAVAGRMRLSTDPTVDELLSVAADTGISPGSLAKAQEAVPVVAENSLVYCNRVLLMLLTMTAGGLADTLHAVFDTFGDGGEMSADAFQLFFGYLAENDTELAGAVDQLQIDLAAETTVNFAKVSGTESLQALLAPPADA